MLLGLAYMIVGFVGSCSIITIIFMMFEREKLTLDRFVENAKGVFSGLLAWCVVFFMMILFLYGFFLLTGAAHV